MTPEEKRKLNKFIEEHTVIIPERPKLIRILYHEWEDFKKELFKL